MTSGRRRSMGVIERDDRLEADQPLRSSTLAALERRAPRGCRSTIWLSSPPPRICLSWSREVVEVEPLLAQLALELLGLLLVDRLLRLLDEGQHVAHAEDARGHAVGVEELEVLELLADAGQAHRLAGHR